VIESQYERNPDAKWSRYNWVDRFDTRERCEAMGFVYEETTLQASGRVWQESGIHGTVDLEYACALLRLCNQHVPEHAHRIVRRTVTRSTECVQPLQRLNGEPVRDTRGTVCMTCGGDCGQC